MNQILPGGGSITVIHFVHGGESDNDWRIACMPGMKEFHETPYHGVYHRTNDVRAATCPACKRSEQYKRSTEALQAALKKVTDGK